MIVSVDPSTLISESPLVALNIKSLLSISLADSSSVRDVSSAIV